MPIPNQRIQDTINSINVFPRTPNNAGLIPVQLKKQKDKASTYIEPKLARPDIAIEFLLALKENKNPHYENVNVDTLEAFKRRCYHDDLEGYNELFPEDAEIMEWQPVEDEFLPEDQDEDEDKSSDEEESREAHPIKKHQYEYDKSFFMADMHPEMHCPNLQLQPAIADRTIHDHIITVAPGEDQKPVDICYDPGWDVKAYPHLSNMDGSNGLSQARQVKQPNTFLGFI